MKVAILGSTGMLGRSLVKEAQRRGITVVDMALTQARYSFDIQDDRLLTAMIKDEVPDVIINTIALINIKQCEDNPGLAYAINARPVSVLAQLARTYGSYLVHISTDHFYHGDGKKQHAEDESVVLLNEYARTKYAAEQFALTYYKSLVVRTNIVGYRFQQDNQTFVEWVLDVVMHRKPFDMFHDYFTSSIDVNTFSHILFHLICNNQHKGILNIASSEVSSKEEFIRSFAQKLGYDLSHAKITSMNQQQAGFIRAGSSGLDVTNVEKIIKKPLPGLEQVTDNLVQEYRESIL